MILFANSEGPGQSDPGLRCPEGIFSLGGAQIKNHLVKVCSKLTAAILYNDYNFCDFLFALRYTIPFYQRASI